MLTTMPTINATPRPKPNKSRARRKSMIAILKQHGESPYQIAISVLMNRLKLNWGWKLEAEQRSCIVFADEMRRMTISGQYKGIWCHIPNEGKRSRIVAMILLAMGLIPGSTDYFFMGEWGHGVIEFKEPGRQLQDTQVCFRDWCRGNNINHVIAYSWDQGIETLKSWGALT